MARAPPRRNPRNGKAPRPAAPRKEVPAAPGQKAEEGPRARLTPGQRAAQREERKRQRRARRAGERAVRRERLLRFVEWLWPTTTRDVGKTKAVVILVLNVAPFPGLGTILYGQWARGLLQFVLTFLFLIGWVWAISDGIRIMRRAFIGAHPRHERPVYRH